tara:strand:+ start:674 stop:793 length:120 start_codon:yes stop_codon:yes gene_type:complete
MDDTKEKPLIGSELQNELKSVTNFGQYGSDIWIYKNDLK